MGREFECADGNNDIEMGSAIILQHVFILVDHALQVLCMTYDMGNYQVVGRNGGIGCWRKMN
jgi:hypothetical protein